MDYVELARQKALKYGLDPTLFVRQIQAESSFNPNAVSPKGAIGLGQIMPATAKELGINPEDPDQNLDGAARYMRQQLDTFGDYSLALAAYNAGAGNVRKAGGIPNFTETQNYVSKIMGTGGSAMNANPMGTGGLLAASQAIEEEYKQEQADKPLFQRDSFKDMAGDMAILFNSMRMEPDDNIVQAVNSIKNKRTEKQARNKTVELMKRAGRDDLAAAAEAGVLSAKEAYATMLSDAAKIRERQAGMKDQMTLEMFKAGLKGQGTTDTTDYKNYLEFKKTNPNITFEEFYTRYKNKPDIQNKGVYRDKSGNIIGEVNYDKSTGQFFQFDPNGQRQILDMKELTPVTDATFAKTIPSYNEFVDLSEELQSDVGSMRQLEKYMTAINNTNEGFARLADDLSASAKTLLSSYIGADYAKLSPEELNLRISRGLQQGLIGRFRIETVGGGVMTEQDALRIIQNLGGDVTLLQNKEVVAKQIKNLFDAKKSSFDRKKKQYDIALNQIYGDQGFEPIEPYKFDESVFNLTGNASPAGNGAQVFPNAPPVGTVSKGYRFKGGDPSIKSNWEPI